MKARDVWDTARRLRVETAIPLGVGLLVFVVAFVVIQTLQTRARTVPAPAVPTAASVRSAPDSLAPELAPGQVAFSLPVAPGELPMTDLQPGDRLDVVAVLPAADGGPPIAGVVVRGAAILRPPSSSQPSAIVLRVTASDAMALAHALGRRLRLTYALWPASGPPPLAPPLSADAARARLGLPPASPAVETPTVAPAPTVRSSALPLVVQTAIPGVSPTIEPAPEQTPTP